MKYLFSPNVACVNNNRSSINMERMAGFPEVEFTSKIG